MGRRHLDPAGVGGHRGELPTEQGGGTGFNHCAAPRRRHSRLLRADLGSSRRGLCSWPDYLSPPSRCGGTLSEPRDDLRRGLWPDLGAEPWRLCNLIAEVGGPEEVGTMLYFSLTTLTTTGYGDIAAVDPFARSLANFEAVLGQFYLAITVARLVTL